MRGRSYTVGREAPRRTSHCEPLGNYRCKATRFGLYKCYACRRQFRVTVGTIFEKSHVPLHLWLQAFYLIAEPIASPQKNLDSNGIDTNRLV